ncbi:cell surface glycoprotein CD200 receptor 1-B-like isoform X1 [Anguilla anguilla]|uniref:cell surface glycoprotein CD200 receptor 1-B-like isoform X1 n=1 Tax=Anguilla anguilla TaxID=7936 RepID=UPI0015B1143E|nr:cell surface glycoprotein CD200 receptor 1-B-like isoform X1 [Anguilla anguilla]XP_035263834.1 cell surface glycoprotein CD200 receptor 1-B-like isoform X1 [Anguilla anguilla]XP_035263835.1 cell surface glycoprotein CD200 receptor 1-B-like isoform X1 [Anguilla anguilla]
MNNKIFEMFVILDDIAMGLLLLLHAVVVWMNNKIFEMFVILGDIAMGLLLLLHAVVGNYIIPTASQGPKFTKSLLTEFRSETHDLGSGVDLICTNKTWNEMIHTIWKLNTERSQCTIASGFGVQDYDSCNDGKLLNNTKSGGSYLHIPFFSKADEGLYHCEAVYRDGSYSAEIKLSAEVPVSPQISTRLDIFRNGKREVVCSAIGGKPAASISWRNKWNSSATQSSTKNSDGSFTMESRLILPDHVPADNLSCIITHPSWTEGHTELIQALNHEESTASFSLQYSVLSVCSVMLMSGFLAACFILRTSVRKKRNKVWRPIYAMSTVEPRGPS